MSAAEFGRFVAELRRERFYIDERGRQHQWSQSHLGELTGYTSKQISDIERGKVGNLDLIYEKVTKLAGAFGLTEQEKVSFFALAGFVYAPRTAQVDRNMLRSVLEQTTFPVSVRTRLWDFIAFNGFHRALWGYTAESIDFMRRSDIGANLLQVLFDPHFSGQTDHVREFWREEVIWKFRANSFRYIHTTRYKKILQKMMKEYDSFRRYWALTQPATGDAGDYETPKHPMHAIRHPTFGEITVISLRLPSFFTPEHVIVNMYIPTAKSEDAYSRLRESVANNDVYFFDEHPLDG